MNELLDILQFIKQRLLLKTKLFILQIHDEKLWNLNYFFIEYSLQTGTA